MFFFIMAVLIYFNSLPAYIFSEEFKEKYSVYFCHIILVLEAVTMVLHIKMFHENFITSNLVKSIQSVITFEREAQKALKYHIYLMIWDLLLVPLSLYMLVGFASQGFSFKNIKIIF